MSSLLTCRVHNDSDASSAPTENGRVALAMPTYYLIIVPLTHTRRLLLSSTLVAKSRHEDLLPLNLQRRRNGRGSCFPIILTQISSVGLEEGLRVTSGRSRV